MPPSEEPLSSPPDPTPSIPIHLQTPFLYQNRHTGQPSSAPLTIRQLCRILCPPSAAASAEVRNNGAANAAITPQTMLLGFDPATNHYDPEGWKMAASIPILREACGMQWFYEDRTRTSTDNGEITKGPVTARNLAELMAAGKCSKETRVYCANALQDGMSSATSEWMPIKDLMPLQMAIEALTEARAMPTSWPASSNEDIANMTFDANGANNSDENAEEGNEVSRDEIADELKAFLSSTAHLATHAESTQRSDDDDENEEEYESDGGTRYVKDHRTGNWIHEALAPKRETKEKSNGKYKNGSVAMAATDMAIATAGTKKRKRNKPKFSAKNARCWIYVTGLPPDTEEDEVATYFSKVGILDLDPETQKPKVKLYRYKKGEAGEDGKDGAGMLKGDASICYARPESVELALQILDENLFRDGAILSVQRAKFEQHGSAFDESNGGKQGRRVVSEAKRKVARLAALQAVGWDEGENGRIAGGLKGLRIVVLMNMFDPKELENDENDAKLAALDREIHAECQELGSVEKITVFSKHPAGVVIVKFSQPNAASDAVSHFNGKILNNGKSVKASFWDGVTDYTMRDAEKEEKETEKRLDEFGDWLENQELPEEFKLRVDGEAEQDIIN
ncbi:hypothetical protein ACHAXS_012539 [Conticribra weissflogii]